MANKQEPRDVSTDTVIQEFKKAIEALQCELVTIEKRKEHFNEQN